MQFDSFLCVFAALGGHAHSNMSLKNSFSELLHTRIMYRVALHVCLQTLSFITCDNLVEANLRPHVTAHEWW